MSGSIKPLPKPTAVCLWRYSGIILEKPAEIVLVIEPQLVGDGFYGFICQIEFPFGFNDNAIGDQLRERFGKVNLA